MNKKLKNKITEYSILGIAIIVIIALSYSLVQQTFLINDAGYTFSKDVTYFSYNGKAKSNLDFGTDIVFQRPDYTSQTMTISNNVLENTFLGLTSDMEALSTFDYSMPIVNSIIYTENANIKLDNLNEVSFNYDFTNRLYVQDWNSCNYGFVAKGQIYLISENNTLLLKEIIGTSPQPESTKTASGKITLKKIDSDFALTVDGNNQNIILNKTEEAEILLVLDSGITGCTNKNRNIEQTIKISSLNITYKSPQNTSNSTNDPIVCFEKTNLTCTPKAFDKVCPNGYYTTQALCTASLNISSNSSSNNSSSNNNNSSSNNTTTNTTTNNTTNPPPEEPKFKLDDYLPYIIGGTIGIMVIGVVYYNRKKIFKK